VTRRGASCAHTGHRGSASCGHRKKSHTPRRSCAALAIRHPRQKSGNSSAAEHLQAAGGAQRVFDFAWAGAFMDFAEACGPRGRLGGSGLRRWVGATGRQRALPAGAEALREPCLSAGTAQPICLTLPGPLINSVRGKRAQITIGCAISGPLVPPVAVSTPAPCSLPVKPVSCERGAHHHGC
jgi:hypothetical protein